MTREDIEALAGRDPLGPPTIETPLTPSRVRMQVFAGVPPAIVDLAAMRDAMEELKGAPSDVCRTAVDLPCVGGRGAAAPRT